MWRHRQRAATRHKRRKMVERLRDPGLDLGGTLTSSALFWRQTAVAAHSPPTHVHEPIVDDQ